MKNKEFYMAVTADELELPLFVSDNTNELADFLEISTNAVNSAIHYGQSGRNRGVKIIKVESEIKIITKEQLKLIREKNGLSLKEMAHVLKCNYNALRHYERGTWLITANFSLKVLDIFGDDIEISNE